MPIRFFLFGSSQEDVNTKPPKRDRFTDLDLLFFPQSPCRVKDVFDSKQGVWPARLWGPFLPTPSSPGVLALSTTFLKIPWYFSACQESVTPQQSCTAGALSLRLVGCSQFSMRKKTAIWSYVLVMFPWFSQVFVLIFGLFFSFVLHFDPSTRPAAGP